MKNIFNKDFIKKIIIGCVIIVVIAAIITIPQKLKIQDPSDKSIFHFFSHKKHEEDIVYENPQEDPNYQGSYDVSSGKIKVVKFFEEGKKEFEGCSFKDLQFSFSPSNSSFSGRFTSHSDEYTGTVYINFTLYDKDKNIVKEFHNRLQNVEKEKEYIVLAEYREDVKNVDSVEISFNN